MQAAKTIEEFRSRVAELEKQGANLIMPVDVPDMIPAFHMVSFRKVTVDTAEQAKQVYADKKFCKAGEFAPTKTLLLRLLQAAGGSMEDSRAVDDSKDPRIVEFRSSVRIPQLDGRSLSFIANKKLDFSTKAGAGKPDMSEAAYAMAKKFIRENAETKALGRAIRAALALQHKYTKAEYDRGFVMPVLVADLDKALEDPEVKRMFARKAAGLGEEIYSSRPALGEAPSNVVVVAEAPDPDEDFTADAPVPEPEPATPDPKGDLAICQCPCDCGNEIKAHIAKATLESVGAVRCFECYPFQRGFNFSRHPKGLVLGLPKYASWTTEQVREFQTANFK